jgi:hypothetical protein
MNATQNNDQLKMSGVDDFEVRNCTFTNGAEGGSGIDMVGCHHGVFTGNTFESQGSNSIQAKGGTQHILIERNLFRDGGQRSVNLGGSTGLEYFRPIDATFEAADLQVYSNVFIRSYAPIAYVGCTRVEVVNNTIYDAENWVVRILQETVDETRFISCGDNVFRNNIVYLGSGISTECNVGPNTRPETFVFSNNLWYNYDDQFYSGPNLPVTDQDCIVGQDPLFADGPNGDFSIPESSPAAGTGYAVTDPSHDYLRNAFASPRSIGAFEPATASAGGAEERRGGAPFDMRVIGGGRTAAVELAWPGTSILRAALRTLDGRAVVERTWTQGESRARLPLRNGAAGARVLSVATDGGGVLHRTLVNR